MSIKLEGIDEILKLLEEKGNKDISESLGKACALVEAAAIQNAPKGTGELRRSIRSKVDGNTGVIYTPLEYAPYLEYGTGLFAENGGRTDVPWRYQDDKGEWHTTSGMKPQPYMRPALNQNRERILEILKEGIING